MIPIVFICDTKYIFPTCVTIFSILKTSNPMTKYKFIILGDNLSLQDKRSFDLLHLSESELQIIDVDNSKYHNLTAQTHVSTAALYKFDIAQILEEYDKVLYLDSDVLVLRDLSKLYNTDISDFYCGAVLDAYVMDKNYKDSDTEKLNIDKYFNSGVLLLNCNKLREENVTQSLIEAKLSMPKLRYMDQDAFNLVFQNKFLPLDISYNYMAGYFSRKYKDIIKDIYNISSEDYDTLQREIAIVHYTGKKPWEFRNINLGNLYLKFYKNSPVGGRRIIFKDRIKLRRLIKNYFLINKIMSEDCLCNYLNSCND